MAVFCWGSTVHGELGLGGIEEERILTPIQMSWSMASDLLEAACGNSHTLLLTNNGKLYSCGNNDHGQLGHELSRKRPQKILTLENYCITQVKCGENHSLALNEWGQIYSWGSDNAGQLGHGSSEISLSVPKIIKTLATKHVIQIASGYSHCLALTNNGEIYAWGSNRYGQIGIGNTTEKVLKPTLISSICGIPIAFIVCGAHHSFAISLSGAVYGWGNNENGQLGVNDETSKCYPTQLKTLRNLGVRYISCGEDFSVFLTIDGGVFTCGSGTYGQLGHGGTTNEILPRMVMELMGSTITQISCGSRHTLALVASRGRVYSFGLGCNGQLGVRNLTNSNIPLVVLGPWVSLKGSTIMNSSEYVNIDLNAAMTVKKLFSGGDHCLVSTNLFNKKLNADDCRVYSSKSQIIYLTMEFVNAISQVPKDKSVDLDFLSNIELIFKSQTCINASFLLSNNRHSCCTSKHHGVDIQNALAAFESLRKIENETLKQTIWDSITNDLIQSLVPSPADVETLRIYLMLPLYHEFINAKNFASLHTPFIKAIFRLTQIPMKIISKWWADTPKDYFERLVDIFKGVVSYLIEFNFKPPDCSENVQSNVLQNENISLPLKLLYILHNLNRRERQEKIPYSTFHLPDIMDYVDIQQDYTRWIINQNGNSSHLCSFPFLFDAKAKTRLLQTDQSFQMHSAMQNAATQGLFALFNIGVVPISQFIVLNVSRTNIVEDTLREIIQFDQNDLKKPLKVKFHDEEAEDAGGVRKEFFMLLLKDILDSKYGMFKECDDTRVMWFSDCTFEGESMYLLIGIICGLAIYNFTIINLPFPLALYKKLLNEPVDLSDLKDISPVLANSMQSILDYDQNDFQEVFDIYFEITREIYGENTVVPLKTGGEKLPVTFENKAEFVELYVDFIFNKSVEKQFQPFYEGFMKVCGGRILKLFEPHELMAVVVGNEDYDWHAFEAETEYKNGYASGDHVIRWFWEVFHELPLSEKKNFLLFLTGSDRIPIQGMKALKIYIQPTSDEKFLPVAHTCFNLLDLPKYSTKERLKYKLAQAIQQTHGFSIV